MKINVISGAFEKLKTGAAVLPVFEDGKPGQEQERTDRNLGSMISRLIKRGDFTAKPGSVHLLYPGGSMAAERLILVGLGKRSDLTLDRLRLAAGKAASHARSSGADSMVFATEGLGLDAEETAQALTEGSMLGLYRFLKYKTNDESSTRKEIKTLTFLAGSAASVAVMRKGVSAGKSIAESTALARDLVNHPGADMTPTVLANQARNIAREFGLKIRVLERKQIEKLGMGAFLGVAAGSIQPPKFIILEYRGGGPRPFIALVGKSITFDSGGISIKPAENMERMKDDMSGGAAVLGAIRNAAALKLKLNIVGLLPAAENMPGGRALKPGDVLRTLSGQTIEIVNTDAEGRLVLADALSYACRYKPSVIVDIATLTGACTIALGHEAIGMVGTADQYKQQMRAAGEKTGERVWELPLWENYFDQIKSDIADMKNSGGRAASVITASALLSRFVQKYPWVHLDIAATAWTDKDRPYTPKGPTGIGARLLTQFLRDFENN
jgi:leucyl aminopeptidase